ncbi:MAG: chemotaxis protein CheX [Thermodesulfobacteriota bacterium]|nr:chemotaxis protein CheX [Thermodesulfobacteriota bacterium]
MDADVLNPFIEAALYVLQTSASLPAEIVKPYRKTDNAPAGDVTCMLSVTGDFNGTVVVSYTRECILGIVSNMFGEEMTELNDEIKDAAGEVTNMIAGQVTTKLAESGKSLVAKSTGVFMEEGHTVDHLEALPVLAVPYKTEKGEFTMEFCFEQ